MISLPESSQRLEQCIRYLRVRYMRVLLYNPTYNDFFEMLVSALSAIENASRVKTAELNKHSLMAKEILGLSFQKAPGNFHLMNE